ncbi:MAG: hypothetical protein OJJ21_10425 [Ferrovibrio sp.]|uniref:recombinase-like helix-turn-helix domain-containing protein n=1 Tax=Ferrovibrio sp. TaxID=1917215 RepID=UPI002621EB34|nr:recombinase-like helix-turn-helix domain-containing protein [Ferrovibrio sp.]MCW0234003.1 hypothetical protein [Ferrovibrio sp.]
MEFNPYLVGNSGGADGDANKGGPEAIEQPARAPNIPWQTRPAALTEFEATLADTLMAMFRDGVDELPAIVARLNAAGPRHPEGSWTEANYQSLMARLAHGQAA